jgi:hypothetical protein
MRRFVVLSTLTVVVATVAVSHAVAAEGEQGIPIPFPGPELELKFDFRPSALPQREPALVSLTVSGEFVKYDDEPPLSELIMEFDRSIDIHTDGIPVCGRSQLRETTETSMALSACGLALIGEGQVTADWDFDEIAPVPRRSRLLVFKGGEKSGRTTLLLHAYFEAPFTSSVVIPMVITKDRNGRFGTRAVAKVPTIAGGAGLVSKLNFRIFREVKVDGQYHNPVSASCADGELRVHALANFLSFARLETEVVSPCTERG